MLSPYLDENAYGGGGYGGASALSPGTQRLWEGQNPQPEKKGLQFRKKLAGAIGDIGQLFANRGQYTAPMPQMVDIPQQTETPQMDLPMLRPIYQQMWRDRMGGGYR